METEHGKEKYLSLIFNETANSPFLVDLEPVPTLNAFAYIPNLNSYIQGVILGRLLYSHGNWVCCDE